MDVHQCDDHAVTDLPEVEDGVVQIGDRIAKRPGCRKKFGLGVGRVGISETEVHVRRRECGDGVLVCSVDGADQCPNQVAGCKWLCRSYLFPLRIRLYGLPVRRNKRLHDSAGRKCVEGGQAHQAVG